MNKNKKSIIYIGIFLACILAYVFLAMMQPNKENKKETLNVVTSFNPVYVATLNIVEGVENVKVSNITSAVKGCPHEYQLSPKNMEDILSSDLFIINGLGMEAYLEDIAARSKDVKVIDASKNIHVEKEEAKHEEEHKEEHKHEHGVNPHVWLDIDKYILQVEEITKNLVETDSKNKDKYIKNKEIYISKLNELKKEMSGLDNLKNTSTVIFHNSSEYLLENLNIKVVDEVNIESESGVSANSLKNIIDKVKLNNIKYIITDPSYSTKVPDQVYAETGAIVCKIDSLVNANEDNIKDSYINTMKNNIEVLKKIK
ncbi:MAG: metal ABC transporter substrate-binding protein [Clostridia bacterium]